MDSLKRALKGVFKRGKKNKQEHAPSQTQDPTTKPPQLPPVQNASPLQNPSTAEQSKPLPPTHPLATGQQPHPQEAVPQDRSAQPGPPAPIDTTVAAGHEAAAVRQAEISPLDLKGRAQGATLDTKAANATDGSAAPVTDAPLLSSATPAPAQPAPAEITTSSAANGVLEQPTKADSAIDKAQHDISLKENAEPQPNGTTIAAEEKKQIAHEEPPPIKTIQVAPGMSATSGPLEDFPEGGEALREE